MKRILGAIFGSPKNTETIVEGAVSGIDKLFYTGEERAGDMHKTREWFIRYLEASQPQNLARRLIAISVTALWAFLVLLGVVAWQWSEPYSKFVFDVLAEVVATPFAIIIGFYFAAHIARQMPGKENNAKR